MYRTALLLALVSLMATGCAIGSVASGASYCSHRATYLDHKGQDQILQRADMQTRCYVEERLAQIFDAIEGEPEA